MPRLIVSRTFSFHGSNHSDRGLSGLPVQTQQKLNTWPDVSNELSSVSASHACCPNEVGYEATHQLLGLVPVILPAVAVKCASLLLLLLAQPMTPGGVFKISSAATPSMQLITMHTRITHGSCLE